MLYTGVCMGTCVWMCMGMCGCVCVDVWMCVCGGGGVKSPVHTHTQRPQLSSISFQTESDPQIKKGAKLISRGGECLLGDNKL